MEDDRELRKSLNTFDAFSVVVGAIIGVGIFFTPSEVAALSGSMEGAMAAWGLGGFIALLGALSFAKLGRKYPVTGGQYEILKDAYGPYPAFLYVFCNITAIQAGSVGIISLVCAQNLWIAGAGRAPAPFLQGLLAVFLVGMLVSANVLGVRYGAFIQDATVVLKFLAIALIVLASFLFGNGEARAAEPRGNAGALGIFAALVPALFSFGGWQHALWIGGEIKEGERRVPFAIISGVTSVFACYIVINIAYFHALGYEGVAGSGALAADAAAAVLGEAGRKGTAFAVALSAFGVLNAQFLSGPRLVYAMAKSGRFFKPFGRAHKIFKTPHNAIILLGVMAAILIMAAGEKAVSRLLTGVVFIDCCFFILTAFSIIVMVGAYQEREKRICSTIGITWIIVASIVYVFFFRKKATARG